MNCRYCGNELRSGAGHCPHCGFDANAQDLESVLKEIVRLEGVEKLLDGQGLLNLLADVAPELKKERILLSNLVNTHGYERILESSRIGETALQKAVQNTARQLSEDYSVDPARAKEICEVFASAVTPDQNPAEKPKDDLAPTGKSCPACGLLNAPDAQFCSGCGAKLSEQEAEPGAIPRPPESTNICPFCGAQIKTSDRYCSKCKKVLPGGRRHFKPFFLVLAVLVTFLIIGLIISLPKFSNVLASGKCGDNCTWTLDADGVLTVRGSGVMYNYDEQDTLPWEEKSSQIKQIVVKNGVTRIGNKAFYGCFSATKVVIPQSVTEIGTEAFLYCPHLQDIEISSGNNAYCMVDKVLFNKNITKLLLYLPTNPESQYIVPSSVTRIENYAFADAVFSSVTLPSGLKSIGKYVFYNCKNLTSVRIPKGVKTIGDHVFYDCEKLKSVYLPQGINGYFHYIFEPSAVSDIYYSGSPQQWAEEIRYNCEGITVHYNSW